MSLLLLLAEQSARARIGETVTGGVEVAHTTGGQEVSTLTGGREVALELTP